MVDIPDAAVETYIVAANEWFREHIEPDAGRWPDDYDAEDASQAREQCRHALAFALPHLLRKGPELEWRRYGDASRLVVGRVEIGAAWPETVGTEWACRLLSPDGKILYREDEQSAREALETMAREALGI